MEEHEYKKKNAKQRARLILIILLFVALVWIVPRYLHSDGAVESPAATAQPASETAEQGLVLLTEPPRTEAPAVTPAPTPAAELPEPEEALPVESGSYTEVEDVAYYLHTYGHLPDNYITKSEAEDAGWLSYKGNLWDVAYGASIGGDRYGNYDGQLPKGERYYEADVNYDGGYRGEERIVYTDDGDVWYTSDHYESFEKLY